MCCLTARTIDDPGICRGGRDLRCAGASTICSVRTGVFPVAAPGVPEQTVTRVLTPRPMLRAPASIVRRGAW
jgi:hypothetical protein